MARQKRQCLSTRLGKKRSVVCLSWLNRGGGLKTREALPSPFDSTISC